MWHIAARQNVAPFISDGMMRLSIQGECDVVGIMEPDASLYLHPLSGSLMMREDANDGYVRESFFPFRQAQ